MINTKLKNYIEKNIFPIYSKNDEGHNLNHINVVIKRSLNFAKQIPDINIDMVYTIASYHDLGCYIDRKNHEKISADMLLNDNELKHFFSEEEIKIMSEAVCDHRASLEYEPRSIYGKIVSSADRTTSVDSIIERTHHYTKKHFPEYTLDQIIERAKNHLIEKFSSTGYASKKIYFKDEEYEKFIKDIDELVKDHEYFKKKYMSVNNITL